MEHFILFILGFLGVVSHCLMKLKDMISDAKRANMSFTVKDYIKSDWIGICLSFIAVIAWYFLFSEVSLLYPKLENFMRISFIGMGLTGSYVIQKFTSRAKGKIRDVIDEKTNKADNINT